MGLEETKMPEIKLTNVTKRWGKFYAVDKLTLNIAGAFRLRKNDDAPYDCRA